MPHGPGRQGLIRAFVAAGAAIAQGERLLGAVCLLGAHDPQHPEAHGARTTYDIRPRRPP
jgi:hypothetical protein